MSTTSSPICLLTALALGACVPPPAATSSEPTPANGSSPATTAAADEAPPPSDGAFDLRQVRRIAVGEDAEPTALTVDGDFLYYQSYSLGTECGSLYKTAPYEAVFVLCGEQVVAGPLTTGAQIEEVFAILSDRARSAHDATTAIINNYPTGGNTRYRIYDQHGRVVGEH